MTDPASVNVSIQIAGLSLCEAACALEHAAPGASFTADVTHPALGPRRYGVSVSGLSVKGVRDLATAMFEFFERMADGDAAGQENPDAG